MKSFKHEALAHAQKLQPEPKSTNYNYDYASKICQTWRLLFFRFEAKLWNINRCFLILSFKIRFTYTLGARGFSFAVSGFGYTASPLVSSASRPACGRRSSSSHARENLRYLLHLKQGGGVYSHNCNKFNKIYMFSEKVPIEFTNSRVFIPSTVTSSSTRDPFIASQSLLWTWHWKWCHA